ncbi:XRE family transcriptional regulator [Phyllobacterium sp. 22229]|uniref:XRE family transcriptional regulator n=1 Tax=Agrobacterium radiobacter TaxID=362 RepID=A0ABD5LN58_AGRRD
MSSLRVDRALRQLGQNIQIARKKRRIATKDFADRLGVAEGTVFRLEKGDPGVRLGTFAMALLALGELLRLEELLDPSVDDTGLMLDRERLPKRIDRPRTTAGRESRDKGSAGGSGDDEGTAF